jgi:uncharacterized protein (DUF885 family)
MTLSTFLTQFVSDELVADPIMASDRGAHDNDDSLGEVSKGAFEDSASRRRAFLVELEATDRSELSSPEQLDFATAVVAARSLVLADEGVRVWQRAPYWYAESLGRALTVLMTRDFAPFEQRLEHLLSRLAQVDNFLSHAAENLVPSEVPALWVQTALVATDGVLETLRSSIPQFAAGAAPTMAADLDRATRSAAAAVGRYRGLLEELLGVAAGTWACGADYFDSLLREHHLLEIDHDQLYELGRQTIEEDRKRLIEFARQVDPDATWQEQIARIKDNHPQPDQFLRTYEYELERARAHTMDAQLASLPEGEVCRMGWVPEFMRASLPIAVMSLSPPFEKGLESNWLVTPSDVNAPMERRVEQMRDNCYVFAESIAGHEIYPGHHLQRVHHKLGTSASPIRSFFTSPQFLEGWGLYVEDLFEETGFFDNAPVLLFKHRNALWRSTRVVIDVGLHTRGLPFEDAVRLLNETCSLDRHMAEGEVRRYCRHDNPSYPSSYLLGKNAIHGLRDEWTKQRDEPFSYLAFHDQLMSYGTLPVRLLADQMLKRS